MCSELHARTNNVHLQLRLWWGTRRQPTLEKRWGARRGPWMPIPSELSGLTVDLHLTSSRRSASSFNYGVPTGEQSGTGSPALIPRVMGCDPWVFSHPSGLGHGHHRLHLQQADLGLRGSSHSSKAIWVHRCKFETRRGSNTMWTHMKHSQRECFGWEFGEKTQEANMSKSDEAWLRAQR